MEEKKDDVEKKERDEMEVWASELIDIVKKQLNHWRIALFVVIGLWFASLCGFIWYLNQYDFISTVEQTGVYTLLDSEGNVISSDIKPEQVVKIMEIIRNGENQSDKETDEKE